MDISNVNSGVEMPVSVGLPVFAIGVGLSTLDKASVNHYVQSHIQINEYRDRVILVSVNPAATKKYGRHIGKCVKVLDMTGLKLSALSHIKVNSLLFKLGCSNLQIMDYDSLPHFCRRQSYGSSRISSPGADDCYSLDHPFHQQFYNYIKQQALSQEYATLLKQGCFPIEVPVADTEGTKVIKKLESELHKVRDHNGLTHPLNCLHISGA
ncbi:hypothetical protein GW17_00006125 [Ensete ventricosum]|nr:hypothetical protein GW17_00006125 [Ensete ventricosum]